MHYYFYRFGHGASAHFPVLKCAQIDPDSVSEILLREPQFILSYLLEPLGARALTALFEPARCFIVNSDY